MTTRNDSSADPGDNPVPPIPPIGPPKKITNLWTGLLVFGITVIGIGLRYAWDTFRHFTDFNQYSTLDHWTALVKVTFNGFLYGLIPGFILALFVVLAAAGGPEIWGYLGPIIMAAAKNTMNFVRGMSLAFRGRPLEPKDEKDSK
ncbi:MAG TPA: hypothetical protein V6C97_22140 [Oculatellaceae cyanobacterium]